MSQLTYNEMLEPDCKYCGDKVLANRSHFHGKPTVFHPYTNCRSQFSAFKKKVDEIINSFTNIHLHGLAYEAYNQVIINKKSAKWWYMEIKLQSGKKNLPMIVK